MRSIERRQAILEKLCSRRFEKVENFAYEFGVTDRTIMRDIAELSLTYPIYTQPGPYGGIYVAEGFYLGTIYLNSEQKMLLERLRETVEGKDKEILESILTGFTRPMKK